MVTVNKLAWTIGGAQGSGVDSSATMFAWACANGGLNVYGKREYYSNIKGEHSYFALRIEEKPIRSHVDHVDLLATFDAETVVRHAEEVSSEGGIIYDPSLKNTRLKDIPTLDTDLIEAFQARLKSDGNPVTVFDTLAEAEARGVKLYPVPYNEIIAEVGKALGEEQLSKLTRTTNTMALAISFSLLGFDLTHLNTAIEYVFGGRKKIVDMNVIASQKAAAYANTHFQNGFAFKLQDVKTSEKRILAQGTDIVALGKIVGGLRFMTYYPITPAADEADYLEANEVFPISETANHPEAAEVAALNKNGGSVLVVQTEDEIAAITMAIGGALAGARSSTCTSGPGFDLMTEGLGWAGINEVPLVVTLYQRAGPSTGLPTRHEQGELRLAIHAGHGEFPRMVLASGDLEECFYDAAVAMNYAERYQLPVIHLVDKALANSNITLPTFDTHKVKIERGKILTDAELKAAIAQESDGYKRFKFTDSGISPRIFIGTPGAKFWNTGDEHDERGHITEDPHLRTRMMDKRMRKLETASDEISEPEKAHLFGDPTADTTIVSWGSTKGAILDAMDVLRAEGVRFNFLQIRLIHPFPSEFVNRVLAKAKTKIGVEMNYSGQLCGVIRENTGINMDYRILKYNGRPFSQDEIHDGVKEVLSGKAQNRLVMTHGA